MALITLRNITLAFGGPPLFDGINLQIGEGERLCLMGRNGTGKSTLLKLIAGEIPPEGGEIMRQQGVRVALVSQEVPRDLEGTVFDVVAQGMGEATALLAEYHRVSHLLAVEGEKGSWHNWPPSRSGWRRPAAGISIRRWNGFSIAFPWMRMPPSRAFPAAPSAGRFWPGHWWRRRTS